MVWQQAAAPEEETLQKMEEKNAGAKPEVTSHYVPTARGTESISRRIVSHYQGMQTRSLLTSSMGDTSMGIRRNDMSWGKIVIAQITSG